MAKRSKRADEPVYTIHDAITAYWAVFELNDRLDRKRPMGIFTNHLEPFFEGIQLSDIDVTMVERYLLQRKRDGAAVGTLWRELRLFKCLINIAASREWVSTNKFRYIKLPKEKHRDRIATVAELDKIRSTASSDLWDLGCIALHTGLRLTAILGLNSGMIEDGWLRVPKAPSSHKTNCPMIPVTPLVREILSKRPEGFQRWGASEAVGKAWRYACHRVGIEDLHFHDLRHTFSTWLQELGVSIEERSYLMGHSMGMNNTTMKHYSHADPRNRHKLKEAISLLATHRGLIEKGPEILQLPVYDNKVLTHRVV